MLIKFIFIKLPNIGGTFRDNLITTTENSPHSEYFIASEDSFIKYVVITSFPSVLNRIVKMNIRSRLVIIATIAVVSSIKTCSSSEVVTDVNNRIIGGSTAERGQFPYMVSLRMTFSISLSGLPFRGASIISDRWIVSAAHCTSSFPASAVVAVVGAHHNRNDGEAYSISQIVSHPNYDESDLSYDLALLQTCETIQFNEFVQPIPLQRNFVAAGVPSVVSGWGAIWYKHGESNGEEVLWKSESELSRARNETFDFQQEMWPDATFLQFLNVVTLSDADCGDRYGSVADSKYIHNHTLCAYAQEGQGACVKDSGGPLVADGQLIGVMSFVRRCAVGMPDAYIRVTAFLDWMHEVSGVDAI